MAVMNDQAAPGELELVRELVNTLDIEAGADSLSSPESARRWLAAHDLAAGIDSVDARDLARLIEVREALRELMLATNEDAPPPPRALDALNALAEDAAVGLRFGAGGAELVACCDGFDQALARLFAIVHEAMREGTWRRLKACPADDCRWAFYDHSRNRSGTWCRMEECGNRAKARSFRERRRSEAKR